jgi:transposase
LADAYPVAEPQCAGCRERDEVYGAIIAELQARIAALEAEIRELKARLGQNSSNSSRPPSSDPPQTPKRVAKPPTGRKPGGQPGHPGHARTRLPASRVNDVRHYWPATCERCRAPLPQAPQVGDPEPAWHQVAEIPRTPATVTEHQGHGSRCACCGHCTWAEIPPEVRGHGFGPNLAGTVAYLSGVFRGSKRMIAELIETLFEIPISLGTIANLEQEVSAALSASHREAEQVVWTAAVKSADETGWREGGKRRWLWMAATQSVAFFRVCVGRGKAALHELLGEVIEGIVSSDRWSAYNDVGLALRQLCWAHLKRDFQKWVDRGGIGIGIGQAGLDAARRLFCLWKDFREGRLDRPALQAGLIPVQDDLRAALQTGVSCADPCVHRFCRNVLLVFPALWTFARVEGVEPTNNHAERTLRHAVIWRKVSFGNHCDAGCRFAERILTVVQTLRLQQRSVLEYLRHAVVAHRENTPAPRLCLAGVQAKTGRCIALRV